MVASIFTKYDLCIRKKEEKDFEVAHYCVIFWFLDMMTGFPGNLFLIFQDDLVLSSLTFWHRSFTFKF
jgi:hypothetical protein